MKIFRTILCLIYLSLLHVAASQACHQTCGKQSIKYPFGTGQGCGDPRFQKYIICKQNQLTLSTHTSSYPITAVDYSSQIIYITDPTISTCACTQDSKGFSLDWDAPFTFHDSTIFALLNCATSSSIFKSNGENNATSFYCDPYGTSVCSLLNSCRGVSKFDTDIYSAISTCCVYDPVVLGPSFDMDLKKLQCGSYSGIYGFDGKNMDPNTWNYGVAIKYKFNFNNDYPTICADCEKSNGVCGYNGEYDSFVCNCPSGINTSTSCFFAATWSSGLINLPWQFGICFLCALLLYTLLIRM